MRSFRLFVIVFLHLVAAALFGQAATHQSPFNKPAATEQKAPKPPAAAAAPVATVETVYPLPLAERDKFRDLQHENDAIEIENQRMLVKIEQNKALQAALVDQETIIASQFGRTKQLDLAQYEVDPAQIALRKKKAK
jgi:hypothetical protein